MREHVPSEGGDVKRATRKSGYESRGTRAEDEMRWRGPSANANYSPRGYETAHWKSSGRLMLK
jgi:hypothetical protein